MSNLQVFNFEQRQVRVIEHDGEPWFVARDVCDVLELVNSREAISPLDDDEKGVRKTDTLGGTQDMNIISESGLYALILRSNKVEARKFRKWVTSEVLPAIRKTGAYTAPTDMDKDDRDALIRELRAEGWKQKEIAEVVGVSRVRVTQIIGDVNKLPSNQSSPIEKPSELDALKAEIARRDEWEKKREAEHKAEVEAARREEAELRATEAKRIRGEVEAARKGAYGTHRRPRRAFYLTGGISYPFGVSRAFFGVLTAKILGFQRAMLSSVCNETCKRKIDM
jgi:prophage antirepressor-like protein